MVQNSADQEEEITRLRAQLDASRQALQDFVYSVSHDLGAPLRAVTSFSSLLQQRYADRLDGKGLSYLHFVMDGGTKAQAMMGGLLQYSRLQTQAQPRVLTGLDAALAQACQALADKIADCGAVIQSDGLPDVMADSGQIRQLFEVLLDNAITYRRPDRAPHVTITSATTSEGWTVTVADNGIGLRKEDCARVFQIFKRLHGDGAYPGIGMGLPIARRIVERHGGSMGIAPVDSGGAACWFTLPGLSGDHLTSQPGGDAS